MKIVKILMFTSLVFFQVSCIQEDDTPVVVPPITGAVVEPNVGGATQPNQVWIDLASNTIKVTPREIWDLGFYAGDEFRVSLNSSLMMAVGKVENVRTLNEVTSHSVSGLKSLVQVANFQNNSQYIDHPNGQLLTQASGIEPIKEIDEENPIYLLNMGYTIYQGNTVPGSVYTMGEPRGWKKIRILRRSNAYLLQFADLDDPTYQEFLITKDSNFNFQFFSFQTGSVVDVQPKKKNWDICFTVFTNLTSTGAFETSYVFSDFVINNTLANVAAYQVTTDIGQGEIEYNNFKLEDIDHSKFITNDQRVIGSNWRTTTGANGAEVYNNKFFVLKNSEGFYFKIRFLRMKNEQNYRGYPQFEYKAL